MAVTPGTTNFLQWNPQQTNQENDTQYASDASRTGGAGVEAEFPSATGNKLFYQLSTFITAFANSLTAKGYSPSDANLTQLESVFANVLTQADQKPNLLQIAYTAAPVFDFSTSNGFEMVLTGNVTSSTIKNLSPGQVGTIILVEDGTGGRNFAWPSSVTVGAIDTTAGAVNVIQFVGRSDGSVHAVTPLSVS